MINFIKCNSPEDGIIQLTKTISDRLNSGSKVLWLIAGGSNIPIAVEVMKSLKTSVSVALISNLTVSETDERYGPVGHADSNWAQMHAEGFDFAGVSTIPILRDKSLNETVQEWSQEIAQAFVEHDVRIGQFGMGADGHIAGILPGSPILESTLEASSFVDEKYSRISLTPKMLRDISSAFAFVFGPTKAEAVKNLRDKNLTWREEPAQILKEIKDMTFYTDCL